MMWTRTCSAPEDKRSSGVSAVSEGDETSSIAAVGVGHVYVDRGNSSSDRSVRSDGERGDLVRARWKKAMWYAIGEGQQRREENLHSREISRLESGVPASCERTCKSSPVFTERMVLSVQEAPSLTPSLAMEPSCPQTTQPLQRPVSRV